MANSLSWQIAGRSSIHFFPWHPWLDLSNCKALKPKTFTYNQELGLWILQPGKITCSPTDLWSRSVRADCQWKFSPVWIGWMTQPPTVWQTCHGVCTASSWTVGNNSGREATDWQSDSRRRNWTEKRNSAAVFIRRGQSHWERNRRKDQYQHNDT